MFKNSPVTNRLSLGLLVLMGTTVFTSNSLVASPVTVQELGVGANQVVQIDSSTLGNNLWVYAGVLDLSVNGNLTAGFCIDPYHWSSSGVLNYNTEPLGTAPKPPGPMGSATALKIEQLWAADYSPGMSNDTAAGLQIAIWELVSSSISPGSFTLVSGNDYGASNMIAWVNANPSAPAANLIAVTGPGQDYVIPSVPDGATTISLLGLTLLLLAASRKKLSAN